MPDQAHFDEYFNSVDPRKPPEESGENVEDRRPTRLREEISHRS